VHCSVQNATAPCETIVRESHNFELACLKMKKKRRKKLRQTFGHLATFWFHTFTISFVPLESYWSIKKTLEDQWYVVIKVGLYLCRWDLYGKGRIPP